MPTHPPTPSRLFKGIPHQIFPAKSSSLPKREASQISLKGRPIRAQASDFQVRILAIVCVGS